MSALIVAVALLAGWCLLAALVGFWSWRNPASPTVRRVSDAMGTASTLWVVAVWITRTVEAGHLPLFGTFESGLSLTAAVLIHAALLRRLSRDRLEVWPLAQAVAALILFHSLRFDSTAWALTISERSWVVDLHAFFAWAAFGALAANAGLAASSLVRRGESGRAERLLGPSLSLGFLMHTAMLASGSFYKFLLFGRAWSFDPIETLSLVAWMSYGTLLHMHLLAGWRGRRLAGWCLALFVLLTITYRGIILFPAWSTYHIFDMDLRIHVTGVGG